MTTISDALKATFDSEWGNGGGGGTKPTLYCSEDLRKQPLDSECYIIVHYHSEDEKRLYTNDEFADYENTVTLTINTAENAAGTKRGDRLKEISDEVKWIVLNAPITGATRQDPVLTRNISAKNNLYWREEMTVKIYSLAVASATAWGSGTSSALTTDELTVNDWTRLGNGTVGIPSLSFISDTDTGFYRVSADRFAVAVGGVGIAEYQYSAGSIQRYTVVGIDANGINVNKDTQRLSSGNMMLSTIIDATGSKITFQAWEAGVGYKDIWLNPNGGDVRITNSLTDGTDSITVAQIADLLMFGSANKAYVPCIFQADSTAQPIDFISGHLIASHTNDVCWQFALPMPTSKGGLKLYVDGWRVGLNSADANDFVDSVAVEGMTYDAQTALDDSPWDTTLDSQALTAQAFTAAVDCSDYEQVIISLQIDLNDAQALKITSVQLRCYYAA